MATPFLNFIAALSIIIVVAKASGYLSTRLGQPAVLGELIAGIILGPTILNMFHVWPAFSEDEHLSESIQLMAELGVLLLMMLAGLELDLKGLLGSGKISGLAGTLGVFVPLLMGYGTARLFGLDNASSFVLALSLAATSVSISAQTLMELNVLRSRVGLALLGAAVFDDILVILLLSVASIFVGGVAGGFADVFVIVIRIILFLAIASALGFWLLPPLAARVNRLPIRLLSW
jgi:Kef-type K+ transport system membrane component KefB